MGNHYVMKCQHGVVVGQCRCPAKDKAVRIVSCPASCKEATAPQPKPPEDGAPERKRFEMYARQHSGSWWAWDPEYDSDAGPYATREEAQDWIESIRPEPAVPLDAAKAIFRAIAEHIHEPGTFRYLVYDRLGFGPRAYEPLYRAGGMKISNLCVDAEIDAKRIAILERELAEEKSNFRCFIEDSEARREMMNAESDDVNALIRDLRTLLATANEKLAEAEGLRPEVLAFAKVMEERLRANDHKPGWKTDSWEYLQQRLIGEARELRECCESATATPSTIGGEAADVANFAMMVADVCGALDTALAAADAESGEEG